MGLWRKIAAFTFCLFMASFATTLWASPLNPGTYFVALGVPKNLHPAFGKVQQDIKEKVDSKHRFKVSPLKELHVTLYYYGTLKAPDRERLRQSLRKIAKELKPFTLHYKGLDHFPFRHRRSTPPPPRVLWAKCEGEKRALHDLSGHISQHAKDEGFRASDFPFNPHVTMLRARHPKAGKALEKVVEFKKNTPDFGIHHVKEFILYRSGSHFDGGTYTVIERFPLGKLK